MLVPVGSAYTPSDFDISRVGGRFKALKEHIYFGNLSGPHNPLSETPTTLEGSLKEIQEYMEHIHSVLHLIHFLFHIILTYYH